MPRESGLNPSGPEAGAAERTLRAYRLLRDAVRAIISATDEAALLQQICDFIVQNGYRMSWIGRVMQDAERRILPVCSAGVVEGYLDNIHVTWLDEPSGQGPSGTAARERRTVINQDFRHNPHMAPWRDAALSRGYQSSIALPLQGRNGEVFAVMTAYAAEPQAFEPDEAARFDELAQALSYGYQAMLDRQQRFDVLEKAVAALAATVESRDPYTAGHQNRVALLAVSIAQELGLDAETCTGIRLAGLVHDIGKIHVPIEFLTTPAPLSDAEMAVIRTHPEVGYSILKDIPFPWPVAEMVRQHHERFDGSGYPLGLSGNGILLGARILAVADVVEAISSQRPYRPARGVEAAVKALSAGSGTLFDPAVVAACLRLLQAGELPASVAAAH